MPEVPEYIVNDKLAEILSRDFGIDCRAERIRGRRRPDIRCYYKGFIISIESSYSKSDAERDAEARIEQEPKIADIAIALWVRERFRDVPEPQLYQAIRAARYSVKVFVPIEVRGTLLQYLERSIARKAEPATGWFEDVNLPTLKAIIEHSIVFLIREEEIARMMESARTYFSNFIETLRNLDHRGSIRRNIYDILYRLYGLTVAEAQDPDIAFGHVALSILLSAVFYEHIRNAHTGLRPLRDYVNAYGPLEGIRKALGIFLR